MASQPHCAQRPGWLLQVTAWVIITYTINTNGTASRAVRLMLLRNLAPAQLERRHASHHVDRGGTLERHWLKRDRSVGSAQQNVGAAAYAHGSRAGHTNIFAGECACRNAGGRRKHCPAQHTAGAKTDAHPHRIECAVVVLRWPLTRARLVEAAHRLVTDENETDIRIYVAGKSTDLRPRWTLGLRRRRKNCRERERGKQ